MKKLSMFPIEGKDKPSGAGRFLCSDIEAIGLTKSLSLGYYKGSQENIHVIVIRDFYTKEVFVFFDPYENRRSNARKHLDWDGNQHGYLQDGIDMLNECESYAFHHGIGFDGLALELSFPDLWKTNYAESRGKGREKNTMFPRKMMDTLVMSRLLNPDRKLPYQAYIAKASCGAHTIEAHGYAINRHKPENTDWSTLTDSMIHRCIEDTEIGASLFTTLITKEWNPQLKAGIVRKATKNLLVAYGQELQTGLDMCRQEYRGWRLDMPLAYSRHILLNKLIDDKIKDFRPHMPRRIIGKVIKPNDKNDHIEWIKANTKLLKGLTNIKSAVSLLQDSLCHWGDRRAKAKTMFKIYNKKGDFPKKLTERYPSMRGFISDKPLDEWLVVGAFSPIEYEDIPLGNRDTVKQILYPFGWRAVEFNDKDAEILEETGSLLKPWSGKLNEKSMEDWSNRINDIPAWCLGIAEWYIYCSRNGQILNRGDVLHYTTRVDAINALGNVSDIEKELRIEELEFPSDKGNKRLRGLMARAWNFELCMEAQDYFKATGTWPVDGKNDIIKHDDNWRVPAVAIAIGTNTFRMRHKNVVNIPSRGLFPLRDLFIATKGKLIVGCDGSGLELRMLAHFMNDLLYTNTVLHGDIHTHNQKMAGLSKRDMAKTFIYAFLYGSGVSNLAKVCGMDENIMRNKIEEFKASLPSLVALIERATEEAEEYGYVMAVDSRWGRIRVSNGKMLVHTILNVLLQMTGSLTMKYSQVMATKTMAKEGVMLDDCGHVAWLGNIHDEYQGEINADEVEYKEYIVPDWKDEEKLVHIDSKGRTWSAPKKIKDVASGVLVKRAYHRAGEIMGESMIRAGKYLKLNIPLAGEYKIGLSWDETH